MNTTYNYEYCSVYMSYDEILHCRDEKMKRETEQVHYQLKKNRQHSRMRILLSQPHMKISCSDVSTLSIYTYINDSHRSCV